jgi:hypothetical protein
MLKLFCYNVFAATQVADRCFGYADRASAGRVIAVCIVESKPVGSNSVLPTAAISNLPKEDWTTATDKGPIGLGCQSV